MKLNRVFALACAFILSITLVAGCGAPETATYRMVTGGMSGTYYPLGNAMCQIFNESLENIMIEASATGASVENCRLLDQGNAQLAIVQNDILDYAYHGIETLDGNKHGSIAVIASLYPEIIQLVVDAESGINSLSDLKGKRISVGAPDSGVEANARQILEVAGVSYNDLEVSNLSFSESADNLKEKRIDGFFVTSGIPNPAIQEIAEENQFRLVPIPDDIRIKLIEQYPFYSPVEIPTGTYTSQNEAVPTVAVKAVLACNTELSEDVVYSLTQTLFETSMDLAAIHAKGRELAVELALDGLSIPLHPGAEKYYKEIRMIQ